MYSLKKKLLAAAVIGFCATSAQAAYINLGGVFIDPDSPFNINIQSLNLRETAVAGIGDVLSGYGRVGSINGDLATTFCPSCELTFVFDNFVVQNLLGGPPPTQVIFSGGTVTFYVDNTPNFNELSPSTAEDGDVWLLLEGHTDVRPTFDNGNTAGTLFSNIFNGTVANPGSGSAGFALFDVTGGLAQANFDTNTIPDGNNPTGFADFSFDSSFQTQVVTSLPDYPISGQAKLLGAAAAIPEPNTLALLGLGMLGVSAKLRRRKAS